ncbi:hypothetical protein GCM10009858_05100 [Terrabacter carboxydivorans]|uniref:Gram-positive cocci surface proteins LPxTG domain-containing protein n=2 Tax=Terrabacter carboxydivorans TaxID=619730 RepID=A0ABP5XXB5_9MICO
MKPLSKEYSIRGATHLLSILHSEPGSTRHKEIEAKNMRNILSRGAAAVGVATIGAILLAGPTLAQTPPGDGGASVSISDRGARVRADLADLAANQAAGSLPGLQSETPSTGTSPDLTIIGGGAAGLVVVAAAGVTIARRHTATTARTA